MEKHSAPFSVRWWALSVSSVHEIANFVRGMKQNERETQVYNLARQINWSRRKSIAFTMLRKQPHPPYLKDIPKSKRG